MICGNSPIGRGPCLRSKQKGYINNVNLLVLLLGMA